jgi:3',5'-cyclic AMP phosphodiesterase CpdA
MALTECIAAVNACAPDAVIATGDLVDTGSDEEYRRLRGLLAALAAPYYLTPGNHDDPRALRAVYADAAYLFQCDSHLSYAIDVDGLRLVVLDSMKRGRAGGYVDNERLAWLERELTTSQAPVILALHHPPFATGVWPMDWLGFAKRRELEEVVRTRPHIRRVISGHVHCVRTAEWGGTFACTSASTRAQRLLVGRGWQVPKLWREHAGFLVHTWDGRNVTTQVHRLDGSVERLQLV